MTNERFALLFWLDIYVEYTDSPHDVKKVYLQIVLSIDVDSAMISIDSNTKILSKVAFADL